MLQDDLGYDDVAFNGNDANLDVTGNITAAAREGVVLERHYVHWHCSPTRRSSQREDSAGSAACCGMAGRGSRPS